MPELSALLLPAAHKLHVVMAPVEAWNAPLLQSKHAVAPTTSENLPTPHCTHAVVPTLGWYSPIALYDVVCGFGCR